MFDGFRETVVPTTGGDAFARFGGTGPAVVLVHGHPRTSATWEHVAPVLARDFLVVCPDLRGYGRSRVSDDGSKRAMARDVLTLLDSLGIETAAVVGHDRGAYAAFRLAMDAPDRVSALAVLDAVPIAEALDRCDARFAQAWWHWFFLPRPEAPRVISADADAWYRTAARRPGMGDEARAEWLAAVRDPDVVRAMCRDYAAGLDADRAHDEADRAAGRRVRCPTFVAWSRDDDMADLYGDPVAVWRPWLAHEPASAVVDSGHHMAEEAPEQLCAVLTRFL